MNELKKVEENKMTDDSINIVCSATKCQNQAQVALIPHFKDKKVQLNPLTSENEGMIGIKRLCVEHARIYTVVKGWELEINIDEKLLSQQDAKRILAKQPDKNSKPVDPNARLKQALQNKKLLKAIPDDDLTLVMKVVNQKEKTTSTLKGHSKTTVQNSIEDIPKELRGVQKKNLVAIRTGDTELIELPKI